MSWSDKATDPLPAGHPERGRGMRINWGSLALGLVAGYIAAAYLPKFINR